MRLFTLTLLAVCVLMLAIGCSKEKKEEAAKLEMELLEQEAGDTMAGAGDTAMPPDTAGMTSGQTDAQAVPEESEPVEPIPEAPAGGGYTVQVAATKDMEYARELIDLYTQRGYDPFVVTAQVGGETYHRIRIGSFENRADAKLLQAELVDRFSISAWVDELAS
jgi:cell division septation protein DedD